MTARSGIAGSVGFADESTWGIPVAPTVHVPFVSESISQDIDRLESEAIITGQRMLRSQQWSEGDTTAGGDIQMELNDLSKGLLLKHMFGGSSTTGPFSPADMGGLGLTVQVGVPDTTDGTVHPKTLAGGKVGTWEVALAESQIATLGLTVVGRHVIGYRTVADGVTTNTSTTVTSATAAFVQDDVGKPISGTGIPAGAYLASVESGTSATLSAAATASGTGVTFTVGVALTSPSYASGIAPMTYRGGTVSLAGSAYKVSEITIDGDNGFGDDRRFIGQSTTDEPLEEDLRDYGGEIQTEYWSDAAYRRFLAGTESALTLLIARGTKSLLFTCNVRYDGTTPLVDGRQRVGQHLPFKCVGTSSDASGITVTLDET